MATQQEIPGRVPHGAQQGVHEEVQEAANIHQALTQQHQPPCCELVKREQISKFQQQAE